MSESEAEILSPLEIEERATRVDIHTLKSTLDDVERRFANPGLTEEQHKRVQVTIRKALDSLNSTL